MQNYDAIIIGGGHNGFTCGNYLARAGLKVLVLERRPVIGGAAVSEEIVPGFTFSVFSYGLGNLHPKVINDLELKKFGLETVSMEDLFVPIDDKRFIVYNKRLSATQEYLAQFSKNDAQRYPEFLTYLSETGGIMRALMMETPIDPTKCDWRSVKKNLSFLWKYRKIGDNFYKIIDLLTQSADQYLSQWFESPFTRALFSYWGGVGNLIGPKSPGSAWATLYFLITEDTEDVPRGHVVGGMGMVSQAMAASGRRFGLEFKTNSEVTNVRVKDGRATSVVTKNGTEYSAPIIVSNAHCKILFDDLIGEQHLPTGFIDNIRTFNTFSSAWKINVACEAPPKFKAFDKGRSGLEFVSYAHIGPDIEYLERAYDDAKYGWYSSKPWLTVGTPTFLDKTMAPEGKHVVHLYGGHAPYEIKGARWEDERDNFTKTVMAAIDDFAPGFSSSVIDMQVLLPVDIESILNIPNGHIMHGEMSVDQMFFQRPAPHYSDYRTPLHGLYQCGASCHPGGGVTGLPGHHAAREILRDIGKSSSRSVFTAKWKQLRRNLFVDIFASR